MPDQFILELSAKLKQILIESCNVQTCTAEEIDDNDQLIGGSGKLRLDSLDAVEIVAALKLNYGIRLEDPGEAKKVLRTFATLRDYVLEHRQ